LLYELQAEEDCLSSSTPKDVEIYRNLEILGASSRTSKEAPIGKK
jgi:hypothetical protein